MKNVKKTKNIVGGESNKRCIFSFVKQSSYQVYQFILIKMPNDLVCLTATFVQKAMSNFSGCL